MSIVHETLKFTKTINPELSRVWEAFADPIQRARWSVPMGEAMVYEQAAFEVGGRDRYRCGPPESLDFVNIVDYSLIVPQSLVVYTETVTTSDQPLSAGVVTWSFTVSGDKTEVQLTSQVTSFVGDGMIEGNRNGHAKALNQLEEFVLDE
ncbi:uncharacterized protein YndB with AHSA1/START domain [Arthrobacter sp. CAN_A212]|uniref:SRPBCC domain-containing protein n=1 Tax=Arthrobacter sp. CAN_A212 TaxID=2787719 RepID=UPI0018C9C0F6